jgi:hypothetical protein
MLAGQLRAMPSRKSGAYLTLKVGRWVRMLSASSSGVNEQAVTLYVVRDSSSRGAVINRHVASRQSFMPVHGHVNERAMVMPGGKGIVQVPATAGG